MVGTWTSLRISFFRNPELFLPENIFSECNLSLTLNYSKNFIRCGTYLGKTIQDNISGKKFGFLSKKFMETKIRVFVWAAKHSGERA